MLNIVDKYTGKAAADSDEGVVAIEYVIVAAALVVALGALWAAFGTELDDRLSEVIDDI